MTIQTISSENGEQEGIWIASLCALILLLGWLLLPHNQALTKQASVSSFQVSIKHLSVKPLAMIADLRLAHEEIFHLYQEQNSWQSTQQLEDAWISPFVKDKSWSHQGEHRWLSIAPGAYQGISKSGGTGYILNSMKSQVDIWVDLQEKATLISVQQDPLTSAQLIQAGWTQVVFHTEQPSRHDDHGATSNTQINEIH